jgi:hypothetical protein
MYQSEFQGRLGEDQLHKLLEEFPGEMLTRMVAQGIIASEEPIAVLVKEKSRKVVRKDGTAEFKCSNHFLFNIWGYKEQHQDGIRDALSQVDGWIKTCTQYKAEHKHWGCIEDVSGDQSLPVSLLSVDPSALPGGKNGIQTLMSIKKATDDGPRLTKQKLYVAGRMVYEEYDMFPTPPHMPGRHVPGKVMSVMLFDSLYTVPKHFMKFYVPRAGGEVGDACLLSLQCLLILPCL